MPDMIAKEALLKAIAEGDLDAALPLSDWLEEAGEERKATLLRRYYKRWQRLRVAAEEHDARFRQRQVRSVDIRHLSHGRWTVGFETVEIDTVSGYDHLFQRYIARNIS